jgi:hypothetical protein
MYLNLPIISKSLMAGSIILASSLLAITANAEEQKTVEDYINDARPYLHLSCELAWQKSGPNDDEYINIINRIVAISFINHNFDVALVNNEPEAEQERLRKAFYDDIGKQCSKRPQRLLAGVIDRSLVRAFVEIVPEADHDMD